MPDYEAVIGLETHIQLNTASKIFCGCKADSWQDPPNTNICPVCTGLPGALPALNRAVVEKAARLAAAMHVSEISPRSYFARKNYFYPDLPKGYQISQYDEPLARGGTFDLPLPDGHARKVHITKLHVEEDAGKTLHRGGRRFIDFNRCGVPLVEMVTGPDLRTADEVAQYLIRLRQLLRWLEVSDADMERGQLRCDANVSIRPAGEHGLNPKTEIKNVNSIANVRNAVQAEIERQIREVQAGRAIETWTLDWDEERGALSKMRPRRPSPITATSASRICFRSSWRRIGGRASCGGCRSCRWNAGAASSSSTACRSTTRKSSPRNAASRSTSSRRWRLSPASPRPSPTG